MRAEGQCDRLLEEVLGLARGEPVAIYQRPLADDAGNAAARLGPALIVELAVLQGMRVVPGAEAHLDDSAERQAGAGIDERGIVEQRIGDRDVGVGVEARE